MAHYEWGEFGERWYVDDDGNETPAPEMGPAETVAVAAGKQFTDLGRGMRSFVGDDVTQEAQEAERYYAPVEAESPFLSMAGEALPTMAAAPIGGGGVMAGTALQAGMGALEGYLDYDPNASGGQRAAAGALGGVLGDWGGRVAGRVMNMAKGIVQDLRPRGPAVSEAAQRFEDLGGSTLAYQRLEQGTPAANLAERAAQGMESATNPPSVLRNTMQTNDDLFRRRAVEAVGLDPDNYPVLGNKFVSDALDNFNQGFGAVARTASGTGNFELDEKVGKKLAGLPEIKELIQLGDFEGLVKPSGAGEDWMPSITGDEWMTVREAVSEAASNRFDNGRSKAGERLLGIVDDLDADIGKYVPEEFLGDYAKLREQYRVFKILERPNAISNDGQINVRTLRRGLDSQSQGFGRTATGGGQTVNQESRNLIDLMQSADNPEFKSFRSSGTAENLALGKTLDDVGDAVTGALGGDVRPALGMAGKMVAPSIIGASQMGGGQMFEGAFTPAANALTTGGGFMGRSLLDEALYPFVGAEDERER